MKLVLSSLLSECNIISKHCQTFLHDRNLCLLLTVTEGPQTKSSFVKPISIDSCIDRYTPYSVEYLTSLWNSCGDIKLVPL